MAGGGGWVGVGVGGTSEAPGTGHTYGDLLCLGLPLQVHKEDCVTL